jgi:Uncharacterized protein conserved in archaea (DUF2240)
MGNGMQAKDLFWTISIPFRMYNTKELDLNTFIFTLSFDATLSNCDVTTARKLVTLALERNLVEQDKNKNLLRAKFEIWEPKLLPPAWSPKFINLENVASVDLAPVPSPIVYKPRPVERIKKVTPMEMEPLFRTQAHKTKKLEPIEEKEELSTEKMSEKEAPVEREEEGEKKRASKKKEAKKQEKTKGQKSIQDFFK